MAQNITISGLFDEFLGTTHTGGKNYNRLDGNGLLSSRLVFRGTEDLGGGLKANFLLETGLNPDTGSQGDPTRFFNRQSWVGLSSTTMGEFRLGRLTSPQFFMEPNFDAFFSGTYASGLNNFTTYPVRFDNGFQYIAPTFYDPVKLQVVTSLNEGTTGRRFGSTVVAAEYTQGPVYLGINHANSQNATTLATTKTTYVGGNYAIGAAKLYAVYYRARASDNTLNRQSAAISGSYNITPVFNLALEYARGDDRTLANKDGSQVGFGGFYYLSKRTTLYGALTKLNNKHGATFSLNTATALGIAPAPGEAVSGAQLGIRHNF